jgi:glycerol-3-phosphate cytidylyltransferase
MIRGFTCSTFDILHAGHIAMLEEARSVCDHLTVGLLSDPTISRPDTKNKPVQGMFERYLQLRAVKYVDEIIPYQTEEELEDIFLVMNFDIRILGEEYRDKRFTGENLCANHFNQRKHSFSSSDLRRRIENANR